MAIVYAGVTIADSSITIGSSTVCNVTLAGAPAGAAHGTVSVGDGAFPLVEKSTTRYEAELKGYQIHRGTALPVYIIMWDAATTALYGAIPTMDVAGDITYFPRPADWLRDKIREQWDTSVTPLPDIYRVRELKSLASCDATRGFVYLREMDTDEKDRGRGDYVDQTYNIEVGVEIQGGANRGGPVTSTELKYRKMVAEVMRVTGIYWRWVAEAPWDFIKSGGWRDESDEYSGVYRWVWRLQMIAPLRGRTLTPATLP